MNIGTGGQPFGAKALTCAAGIAVVVVTAAMALAHSARTNDRAARVASAPPRESISTVVVAPAQRSAVATTVVAAADIPVRTTVPARIDFNQNRVTPLFPQWSGRVVRLDADQGTFVREGQVLGDIDSPDVDTMEADYQEARAAARAAQTSLDQAARTRGRAERLTAVEAVPLRDLQDAQVAEAHAAEEVRRAQTAVGAARGKLQIAGFGKDAIERLDRGGPAAIGRLVPLRAPVAGTIIERHVGLGQMVQPGGDALLKLADLSTVWVDADVYEDQLASIRPGLTVSVQTPAYPDDVFAARVDRVAATVDPEKRTIAVRCVVANGDGRLKPGMFATVVLQSATMRHALVVPASAVVASGDRRTVFVEIAPGRYRETSIQPGADADGSVVVTRGVREGDRVVTEGSVLLSRQLAESRSGR
jgi:cobalt-zinc-cadmium efflux system membrane fusion protein